MTTETKPETVEWKSHAFSVNIPKSDILRMADEIRAQEQKDEIKEGDWVMDEYGAVGLVTEWEMLENKIQRYVVKGIAHRNNTSLTKLPAPLASALSEFRDKVVGK